MRALQSSPGDQISCLLLMFDFLGVCVQATDASSASWCVAQPPSPSSSEEDAGMQSNRDTGHVPLIRPPSGRRVVSTGPGAEQPRQEW